MKVYVIVHRDIADVDIAKAGAFFPYQKLKALQLNMRCLPLVTTKLKSCVEANMNLNSEKIP